jgi:hypothetical protein
MMKSGKSLVELAQAIEKQRGRKRDFIADTRHLRMQPTDRGPALIVEERGYPLTPIAHQQLGERVGIPAKYYERMRSDAPELLARNVNHWFGQAPERRMVRTLGGDARAFLSDRYQRIDNAHVAEVTLPVLADTPGIEVVSTEITEKRMYIKAITPRIAGEVRVGDEVQAGVMITNSEVGLGAITVAPLLFRLVCLNGMVVEDNRFRKHHVWQWKKIDPRPVELEPDDQAELDRLIGQLDELKPDGEQLSETEAAADEVCERIHRIEAKRERWRAEDVAASGAILTLGYDGRLRVERGLIRPGDRVSSNSPADDSAAGSAGFDNNDAERTDNGRSRGESDRLIEDLTAHKSAALKAVVGDNPGAALTLVVHALALRLFRIGSEYETCLTLSVSPEDLAGHAEGIKETAAMKAVAERHERWGGRLPDRPADLWDWLIAQSQDERLDLLAHCVGLLVHGVRIPHVGERRRLAADRLAGLVGLDMTDWWQTTRQSYLGRVPKARILEAVAEGVSPAEAKKLTNLKKDDLVARAEELLRTRPWLPPVLRTETAAVSIPAAPGAGRDPFRNLNNSPASAGGGAHHVPRRKKPLLAVNYRRLHLRHEHARRYRQERRLRGVRPPHAPSLGATVLTNARRKCDRLRMVCLQPPALTSGETLATTDSSQKETWWAGRASVWYPAHRGS